MAKTVLSSEEELSRIKGNVIRLCEYWEKFSEEAGLISYFIKQMKDVIDGNPVNYLYPNCLKCEEGGNNDCPWYGEPDGCNNRELKEFVINHSEQR